MDKPEHAAGPDLSSVNKGSEESGKAGDADRAISVEWVPMRARSRTHEQRVREIIRSTPLFHGIGRHEWRLLSHLFHERHYLPDEIIFERGMPGLGMYIIIEGEIRIVGDEDPNGLTLAVLGRGDFFGEMAVVEEGFRTATAVAVVDTELIGIFRPQLKELLRDRPKLGVTIYERIASILARRLRLTDEMLLQQTRTAAHRLESADEDQP